MHKTTVCPVITTSLLLYYAQVFTIFPRVLLSEISIDDLGLHIDEQSLRLVTLGSGSEEGLKESLMSLRSVGALLKESVVEGFSHLVSALA